MLSWPAQYQSGRKNYARDESEDVTYCYRMIGVEKTTDSNHQPSVLQPAIEQA
jgi:hypothetical protein